MTLQDQETAIIAKLEAQTGPLGIPTEPFPERPAEYRLTHPIGKVLVIYGGSTNGPEITSEPISFERDSSWSISLLLRGLRTPQGVYPILDALCLALDSWTPPGCRRARVLKVTFQGNNDGVWVYEITFEATDLVVRPITSWS